MFDIGWTELMVIGIVALIVVGPKDLPGMFRTLGRFTAKLRAMGREFQRAMDAAADESGVKDVASDLRKAANPGEMGLDALKDAAKSLDPRTTPRRTSAATGSTSAATPGAAPGTPPGTPPGAAASASIGPSDAGAAAAGAAVAAAGGAVQAPAPDIAPPDPLALPPSPEDDRT